VGASTESCSEVPRSFERVPALHVHRGAESRSSTCAAGAPGTRTVLEHVQQCLAEGLAESPVMPLSDTLDVMRVVDAPQRALGLDPRDDG
jgi:hypothetical protein